MRIFISLMIFGLYSQIALANKFDTRVTQDFTNTSLKEVFVVLQDSYDLKIAYSDRLVEKVSVDVLIDDKSIKETLDIILDYTDLTYELLFPDGVIVKKKNKNEALFDLIGEVVDIQTGERLPYAYLLFPTLDKDVMSNEEGYFAINDVPKTLTIACRYLGYKDTIYHIHKENYKERILIGLSRNHSVLDEVLVSEESVQDFNLFEQPSVVNVDPKLGVVTPRLAEPDAIRAMHLLPGVSGTNELSSRLFVNGGTANQNAVVFDGFTIYHMDHFFGYYSAVNPYAVKSIRLFKGGFEAKYGGRASSILEMTGKDGNNTKVSGSASINLLSVNSSLEVPLNDKTTFFLSGRRSYTDIFSTSLFESIISLYEQEIVDIEERVIGSSQEFVPKFYYSDINMKLSTRLGAKNRLSFSLYDSNDLLNYDESYDLRYAGDTSLSISNIGLVNWGNVGTSIKWSTLWDSSHFTNISLSYSHYASEYKELSTQTYTNEYLEEVLNTTTYERNNIQDLSLKIDHEWTLSNNLVETGVSISSFNVGINSTLDDSTIVSKDQNQEVLITHYLQNKFRTYSDFKFTLGLRSNYLSTHNKYYFEPRVDFSYKLNSNIILTGATGVYRQFVNQINTENALEGSRDLWLLSDQEIPDQKAVHAILGISHSTKTSLVSLNLYYKNFEGLMDYAFKDGQLLTEYVNYEDLFFEGVGYARGMEILFKKNIKNWKAWASYTLGEVVYSFPELNQGKSYYADHDQRHEINLCASYTLGRFELFSTWYYGSGKPYTDISLTEGQNLDFNRVTVVNTEDKNQSRLPVYHRLDVGVNYNINFGESDLMISANIFNLYNRENIYDRDVRVFYTMNRNEDKSPDMSNVRKVPRAYDTKLMGMTPSISIELLF